MHLTAERSIRAPMKPMRARTESALLVVALALAGAFVASFALGIIGDRTPDSREPPPVSATDPAPASTVPDSSTPAEPAVRVEVLNASGESGLARRATDVLRRAGFDVVFYGNAPDSVSADSTVVLDRVGEAARAQAVARALGLGTVRSLVDPALVLDVTVWLGKDWAAGEPIVR
jgi:hypothetical protein